MREFADWLGFIEPWPAWLRWLLLIPLALFVYIVWRVLLGVIFILVSLSEETRGIANILAYPADAATPTVFMLFVSFVAPRFKFLVPSTFGIVFAVDAGYLASRASAESAPWHDLYLTFAIELFAASS